MGRWWDSLSPDEKELIASYDELEDDFDHLLLSKATKAMRRPEFCSLRPGELSVTYFMR